MTNDTIGVDVSKDHLDTHRMSDGKSCRFANDRAGHTAFIAWAAWPAEPMTRAASLRRFKRRPTQAVAARSTHLRVWQDRR